MSNNQHLINIDINALAVIEQNYQLLDKPIYGGYGVVIKAMDRKTNSTVAIKLLNSKLAYGQDIDLNNALLIHEAAMAARLTHPNIVRILAIEVQPIAYIVMEWIDGQTLWQVPKFESIQNIINLLLSICDAVAFAHRFEVVHLDLSPGNVMIDMNNIIRIVDFGLSIAQNEKRDKYAPGTPGFWAPERCSADYGDKRSDVYSIGAIAYWLLTGNAPGPEQRQLNLAVFDNHYIVSPEFVRIISVCLAENPNMRFADAGEIADALHLAGPRLLNVSHPGERLAKWRTNIILRIAKMTAIGFIITSISALLLSLIVSYIDQSQYEIYLPSILEYLYVWSHHIGSEEGIALFILGIIASILILYLGREIYLQFLVKKAKRLLFRNNVGKTINICQKASLIRPSKGIVKVYALACAILTRCDRTARILYESALRLKLLDPQILNVLKLIYSNLPSTESPPPSDIKYILSLSNISHNNRYENTLESQSRSLQCEKHYTHKNDEYKISEERLYQVNKTLGAKSEYLSNYRPEPKIEYIIKDEKSANELYNIALIKVSEINNKLSSISLQNVKSLEWFSCFSVIMIFGRARISDASHFLAVIMSLIIWSTIGVYFSPVMEATIHWIKNSLPLASLFSFTGSGWKKLGIQYAFAVKNRPIIDGLSPNHLLWGANLTLPNWSPFRLFISAAMLEPDQSWKNKDNPCLYGKINRIERIILTFIFIAIIILAIIQFFNVESKGIMRILIFISLMIYNLGIVWLIFGICTNQRLLWIDRELTIANFILNRNYKDIADPGLSQFCEFILKNTERFDKALKNIYREIWEKIFNK